MVVLQDGEGGMEEGMPWIQQPSSYRFVVSFSPQATYNLCLCGVVLWDGLLRYFKMQCSEPIACSSGAPAGALRQSPCRLGG